MSRIRTVQELHDYAKKEIEEVFFSSNELSYKRVLYAFWLRIASTTRSILSDANKETIELQAFSIDSLMSFGNMAGLMEEVNITFDLGSITKDAISKAY